MKKVLLAIAVLLVAGTGGAFVWIEASKEIRVLCQHLGPGTPLAEVVRTLETGDFLAYEVDVSEGDGTVRFHSVWSLWTVACELPLSDGRVVEG